MNDEPAGNRIATSESGSRWDSMYIFVVVLASLFPVLGFGAYFRNEDGRLLVWLRDNTRLLDALHLNIRYHPMTFRPVSEMLYRLIYNIGGYDPLAYQLVSAVCFVGAVVLMYAIGKRLFESRRTAFLSVLSFFACFYFTLHFLYTPIQGLQFPVELLLVTAVVYLLLGTLPQGLFGYRVLAAAMLSILAVFNHPVSAFLLPVLGIALVLIGWRHDVPSGHAGRGLALKIVTMGFFASLWLLMPVLTSQVTMEPRGIIDLIPDMIKQYYIYGGIFLRGINKVLIPFSISYLIAGILMARFMAGISNVRRLGIGILVAFAFVILFNMLRPIPAFTILSVLLVLLVFSGWRRLFLVLWFFAGMLPILTSPVVTGVYMRHPAIALSLLVGVGYSVMIGDILMALGDRAKRLGAVFTLERSAGAITALAVLALLIAGLHIAPVPVISRQLGQIEYLKNLGNNFRDTIAFLSTELDKDATVYFYRGPTRDEEDQYAYSSTHLERLQPAKSIYYPFYFAMMGRDDITVRFTDELQPDMTGAVIVATNNWEVREIESTFHLETWREFQRGKASAKIYRARSDTPPSR